MPSFANQTFRALVLRERGERHSAEAESILWPDTFNNYFDPKTAKAAVDVLEVAGFNVSRARSGRVLRPSALRLRHARHRRKPAVPHTGGVAH